MSSASFSTKWANALVASSTLSLNVDIRVESSSCTALKRAFFSGASSAPPSKKSRNSLSSALFCAVFRAKMAEEARICLYLANRRSSCESPAQNSVTVGNMPLYASRNSGEFTTAFKWPTTPHARDRRSVTSSSGVTKFAHVGTAAEVAMVSTVSRASLMSCSTAGFTCAGVMAEKRGKAEKSRRGFMASQ